MSTDTYSFFGFMGLVVFVLFCFFHVSTGFSLNFSWDLEVKV